MKVKELIKELINCNMEDDITVQMFCLPNGINYTAALDNHLHFEDGQPSIIFNPVDFHAKTDEDFNPISTTLKNTLHAAMAEPTDDGSYKESLKDWEEEFDEKIKGDKNEQNSK